MHYEIQQLAAVGKTLNEIKELINTKHGSDLSYSTVKLYKNKPLPEGFEPEPLDIKVTVPPTPDKVDVNSVMSEAFTDTVWLFRHMAKTARKDIEESGETSLNFKALAEVAEKVIRYQSTAQKSNITGKGIGELDKEVMDRMWRLSAELYMRCKEEGIEYDAGEHIKHLLNELTGKNED